MTRFLVTPGGFIVFSGSGNVGQAAAPKGYQIVEGIGTKVTNPTNSLIPDSISTVVTSF